VSQDPDTGSTVGPYRVDRRLGRGGMGEVFLAWDPRLEREVAVKRIRSGAGTPTDSERRARFRHEARITAALNHPAIVQVFDLITQGDTDHLVMEYVPGLSLREVLRQGPLPLARGLAVALDVAEGLAYAHRRGVLHRDLKTENVLLTHDGQAKISDFGIALRRSPGPDAERLTREGMVVGTHRAMSPEQACGEEVDARSDLFSLGVLFYELFTGSSPFLADSGPETVRRVLSETPPPASELNLEIPAELSDLIHELLEKNPAMRPASARDVADRLRALATRPSAEDQATLYPTAFTPRPSHPATPAAPAPVASMPPLPRRLPVPLLAGIGILATVAVVLILLLRPGPPPPPLYVAVLQPELRNGTPSEGTDFLAFAVRGALQSALTRFEGVFAKTASEVDAVSGPAAAVARAVAADEVLEPSFICRGRTCSVEVARLRGRDGAVTWSDRVDVSLDDPLTVAQALAVLIRKGYPERKLRQGVPDLRVRPEDYAEYMDIRRRLVAGSREGPDLRRSLEKVRRRSPDFVDAYLLEAQIDLNRFEQTRDPAHLNRALALLADAQSRAPGDPEVGFTRASAQLRSGRLEAAESSIAAFEREAPGDLRALDLRADLLERQGKPAEALALSRKAADVQPSWSRLYGYALRAWRQGETAVARKTLETLLERAPGNSPGRTLLATLELTQGDPARAALLFEEIASTQPSDSGVLANLGLARMLQGDHEASAAALERAARIEPDSYPLLLNLAQARGLQGRKAEADRMLRRVLALSEKDPVAEEWQRLTVRAQAFAQLGEPRKAVAEVQEALRLAPHSGQVAFEASLVYALVGDRTAALVNAERARDLGFESPGWFRLPWFEPLRSDPGFRRLLGEAGT
jgi:tetratricopeptide (TPR) repeat protein